MCSCFLGLHVLIHHSSSEFFWYTLRNSEIHSTHCYPTVWQFQPLARQLTSFAKCCDVIASGGQLFMLNSTIIQYWSKHVFGTRSTNCSPLVQSTVKDTVKTRLNGNSCPSTCHRDSPDGSTVLVQSINATTWEQPASADILLWICWHCLLQ